MAGENAQMDSFLENAGDAGAQEEADNVNAEEVAATDPPEEAAGAAAEEPAQKADDGAAEADPELKKDGRPDNYVPIQSLDEERGMRKDAQSQLREAQATMAVMWIDTVAIQFTGTTSGDDQVFTTNEDQAIGITLLFAM